jgi:hypothetical protein
MWRPKAGDVAGRMVVAVPFAGLPVLLLRSPLVLAVLAAVLAFLVVGEPRTRRRAVSEAAEADIGVEPPPTVPTPPAPPVTYGRAHRLGAVALLAGAGMIALRLLVALARPPRRGSVYP